MSYVLNWDALVDEAVRRRKTEGLTQVQLAALAGVSAPTIISFEKGDKGLSLSKAIDILAALGLTEKNSSQTAQENFVSDAFERWLKLVEALPQDHPSRFPHGFVAYDYEIEGKIPSITLSEFRTNILEKAVAPFSGWPPFWLPTRDGLRPYVVDDVVECWIGDPATNLAFTDAAHADFWRVSREGRAYLQRGFQEDSEDLPKPGTIFDLTLPIWRASEVLLHADALASALKVDSSAAINFHVKYTGLSSRQLTNWAKPDRLPFFDTHRSRTNDVALSVRASVGKVRENIASLILELLQPLYEKFDFFRLSESLVQEETRQLISNARKL